VRSLDVIARSEAHRDLETDPSVERYNNEIRILKRDDGTMVGSFGRNGRNAGQFHWIHAMAVDSKGMSIPPKSTAESVSRNLT
jgi:hypothetical protein